MFHTISQHFTWPSLCYQVKNFVKHCNICQHYKAQRKKYGHVPTQDKQQIANPWHSIAINTIGPWIILESPHSSKSKEPTTFQALTIIDLNTHFMGNCSIEKQGKHHHHSYLQPSLALSLPPPG
jgi:hypothetical protein